MSIIKISDLVKEKGKKKTIEILNNSKFPMMTTTQLEFASLLEEAKRLIKKNKIKKLPAIDKKIEFLEGFDLWD